MGSQSDAGPMGARATSGVVSRRSALPVAETVDRLATAIRAAGAKLFVVVDHSGEAQRVGMALRDTKLLVFGNPAGGYAGHGRVAAGRPRPPAEGPGVDG